MSVAPTLASAFRSLTPNSISGAIASFTDLGNSRANRTARSTAPRWYASYSSKNDINAASRPSRASSDAAAARNAAISRICPGTLRGAVINALKVRSSIKRLSTIAESRNPSSFIRPIKSRASRKRSSSAVVTSMKCTDDETRRLADQAERALPRRSIRHEEPSRGARVEQSHQMCRRFEEFKRVRGRRRIDDLYCESPLRMKVVELCERGVRVGAGKSPAETAVEGILEHAAAPRRTLHKALDEHVPRMLHVEHHRGKLHRRIETRRLQSTRVETGRPRTQPLEPQGVAQPPCRIHRNNSSIESFRRRGQSERCGYCGFSNSAGSEQDYDRPFFEYFPHTIRAATPRGGRQDSIARPLTHFVAFFTGPDHPSVDLRCHKFSPSLPSPVLWTTALRLGKTGTAVVLASPT